MKRTQISILVAALVAVSTAHAADGSGAAAVKSNIKAASDAPAQPSEEQRAQSATAPATGQQESAKAQEAPPPVAPASGQTAQAAAATDQKPDAATPPPAVVKTDPD